MSSPFLLPPALLDLTILRASARFNGVTLESAKTLRARHGPRWSAVRSIHQAALATAPPPPYEGTMTQSFIPRRKSESTGGVLATRSGNHLSELERRVQALQDAVASEVDAPPISEEELLTLYEDLLAIPPTKSPQEALPQPALSQKDTDYSVVLAVDHRLCDADSSLLADDLEAPTLSSTLRSHYAPSLTSPSPTLYVKATQASEHRTSDTLTAARPYRKVISRMSVILKRVETARAAFSVHDLTDVIPITLVSGSEWACLIRVCVGEEDYESAEASLELIRRSGLTPAEDLVNMVLMAYSHRGWTDKTERFMSRILTGPPTPRQRDLHIKSHIKASSPYTFPTNALSVLHSYEAQSLPAPISAYTRLISALFSAKSSLARAQAWDLFAHMRYVAHPTPDALLYTLMIRACASTSPGSSSEPERALDLWTEMTVDHGIQPTAGAYDAVILACARSGRKAYVNEAFRFAKEMLDTHRDARGRSAFRPNGRTFSALLEGAKRIGDLARSRWILAEMVRGGNGSADVGGGFVDAEVNEEVMMHVFHAYASYTPPFKRSAVLQDHGERNADGQLRFQQEGLSSSSISSDPSVDSETSERKLSAVMEGPSFSQIPPQSRSEVIGEVEALFQRILEDTGFDPSVKPSYSADRKFSHVQLTTRLLNSYLSVYYAHSTLDLSHHLFRKLFGELGLGKNARSYMEALERCCVSKRRHERTLALGWAEELWADWTRLEVNSPDVNARMIERAHIAMIRILTLTGNIDRAVDQVKDFVQRYPPTRVSDSIPKLHLRSTRTVLLAERPLVRATSATEVPDDGVPPLLAFTDLEILHHRLVAAGQRRTVGYIKYICKAYEGALRMRRDHTMRAEPIDASSL